MESTTKPGYGNFGNLSKTYDEARKGMPQQVLDYLFADIDLAQPLMLLDVGCGTGIVTRQLAEYASTVIGTDTDEAMIQVAREHTVPAVTYVVTPTENLSHFRDNEFTLVTAFSAFHWFANATAVGEIKRVIKKGGKFFSANRNTVGEFREGYKATLQEFMNQPFPNAKKDFNPKSLLEDAGFIEITEKIFPIVEYMSVDEMLFYVQSTSPWNLVPAERKEDALTAMREYFKSKATSGRVEKRVEITTVQAIKP